MKRFVLIILILGTLSLVGCGHSNVVSSTPTLADQLATPRQLQKLFETSEEIKGSSSNWSGGGGFFLFFGGGRASGSSQSWDYTQYSVMLAWERPDMPDVYAVAKVPLSKVNIKLIDSGNSTVSFYTLGAYYCSMGTKWEDDVLGCYHYDEAYNYDIQFYIDHFLRFVVITTTAESWPKYIEMPLNNPEIYQ